MKEVQGDLIELALEGAFDVIAHGCNCMSTMGAGIAIAMKDTFSCDVFSMEKTWDFKEDKYTKTKGDPIDKLGNIQYRIFYIDLSNKRITTHLWHKEKDGLIFKEKNYTDYFKTPSKEDYRKSVYNTEIKLLNVVNAYTQYNYGPNHSDGNKAPFDYEAFILCMRKINTKFSGSHIGLPLIGAGLARGNWEIIKEIINKELKDMQVTIVHYSK